MVDVLDAGLEAGLAALEPARHVGRNPQFVAAGRLVDYKGNDLAIRALAAADPDLTLTIHGEGPMRPVLERLAESLGVAGRVRFAGWLPHGELGGLRAYRGLIFPTLAEANGIVMQEAMMLGLPVVTLRWGGPEALADDSSAVYIAPDGPEAVVAGLAAAMNRLAGDPAHAAALGAAARARAEAAFDWDKVAASWAAHYAPAPGGRA
jgi:glycosyltransferase involved in cell wall biosynthesis